MKQVLIAIIILLLLIIVFQNCWHRNPACNVSSASGFCKDAACFGSDGTPPRGLIKYTLAKRMAELYANDAGKKYIWNNEIKTDSLDARTIWFDLKRIKSFIGYLEETLCKDSCVNTDHYGIRIYYAKYPDTTEMRTFPELNDLPKEYANHHTLFMVPTYWDEERKMNIDFDPQKKTTNCKLLPLDSSSKEIFGTFFKAGDAQSEQQNHGSLIPPPAGGGNYPQN
ncbi:MAG: hypothetical protein QM763_03910 [Agriterribacter sp.]